MRRYGALSWKATQLWSNSHHIQKLDLGSLTREMKQESVSLAKRYVDKSGVKRCVGKKKALKQSQLLVCASIFSVGVYFFWKGSLTVYTNMFLGCNVQIKPEVIYNSFWLQGCFHVTKYA